MIKLCKYCDVELADNNWYPSHRAKYSYTCKSCSKTNNKKYYPQGRESKKVLRFNNKIKVITHYGGKCECCSENNIKFLTIDHIKGGGNKHRRKLGIGGGDNFYRWLIDQGLPNNEYRALCYNCNITRGHQGFCPCEVKSNHNNCKFCNIKLNNSNWLKFNKLNNHKVCLQCVVYKSRGKGSAYYKNYRLNQRLLLIENYGGKCKFCYQSEPYHLVIDHIFNDGNVERNSGMNGSKLYNFIIKNNFPKDKYQLLCHNCNSTKLNVVTQ